VLTAGAVAETELRLEPAIVDPAPVAAPAPQPLVEKPAESAALKPVLTEAATGA